MCSNCSDFFWGVVSSIVASIIFAIILYLIQQFRYWYNLKRNFNHRKFNISFNKSSEIIRTATCFVCKNVIKFLGEGINADSQIGKFNGEFIMNPFNLRTGDGYQSHLYYNGFNFPKIVIKDENTFFVQTSYVPDDGSEVTNLVYQAFIWNKIM